MNYGIAFALLAGLLFGGGAMYLAFRDSRRNPTDTTPVVPIAGNPPISREANRTTNWVNRPDSGRAMGIALAVLAILAIVLFWDNITSAFTGGGDDGDDKGPVVTSSATPVPTGNTAGKFEGKAGDGNMNWAFQQGKPGSTEFCKALSRTMGGPELKWHPTLNPDGTGVSNSCVLREADDRDPVAWPMTIPDGVVVHIWLLDPKAPNSSVAVTAVGPGKVEGNFGVKRATAYFSSGVNFGHSGEWVFGIHCGTCTTSNTWVKIGTSVPISQNAGDAKSASSASQQAAPQASGGNTAPSIGGGYVAPSGNTNPPSGGTCDPNKDGLGGSWTFQGGNRWSLNGQATVTGNSRYVIHTPGYPRDPGLPAGKSESTALATANCQ